MWRPGLPGLALLPLLALLPFASAGCCTTKIVDSSTGDARDGTYNYNGTRSDLPVFCGDECVYSKVGSTPGDLYCFGVGDLDSQCFAPMDDAVTEPQLAPGAGKAVVPDVPPGEYYVNQLPGSSAGSLQCGALFGVVNEDRQARLDLSAMAGGLVPAATDVWSAGKLVFKRIDGESNGEVQFGHLVGLFATSEAGSVYRLNVKTATATDTDTNTSRLMVKLGDGSACTGPVTYEVEYGVFSADGQHRLDIGSLGTGGQITAWDQAGGNTRFHINPVT